MSLLCSVFLATLAFIRASRGAVFNGIDDLPIDLEPFDFIVGGGTPAIPKPVRVIIDASTTGGTAGSVLASRLSEDAKFNVLLIEAGPEYVYAHAYFPLTQSNSPPVTRACCSSSCLHCKET